MIFIQNHIAPATEIPDNHETVPDSFGSMLKAA